MKMKQIAVMALALAATGLYAQSETYQFEATFQQVDSSPDNPTKMTANVLGGTYYLKPVALNTGAPLFELDFLQRASSVGVAYATGNYEDADVQKTSIDGLGFSGKFYINNLILGVEKSAWNKRFPSKVIAGESIGKNFDATNFQLGYFVLPTTSVSFVNQNAKTANSPTAGLAAMQDVTITTNGLQSRTVMPIANGQHLAFSVLYNQVKRQQARVDENFELGASVRYYPTTKVYFDAGYKQNKGDYVNTVGETVTLGAGYALTPRLNVTLASERFSINDKTLTGATTTVLSAGYRF
jgi:hypothetical protein